MEVVPLLDTFDYGLNIIRELDQTFNSTVNETIRKVIPEFDTDIEETVTIKRRMPYYENIHILPSKDKPTMGGVNLTEKGSLAFTFRYPDLSFYTMTPATREKGELPFKKDTQILRTRCFKGNRSCKAKGLTEWLGDRKILSDFTDINAILNDENWRIHSHPDTVHTCDSPVMPFHSDRQNYSNYYRKMKTEMNDQNGKVAWKSAIAKFESGLGIEYDGVVCGTALDHQHKLSYDKKRKAQPANNKVKTSKDLQIDKKVRSFNLSTTDAAGVPVSKTEQWYRKIDQYGNLYFCTRRDSQLLYEAPELFCDGTFRPIGGIKKLFPQLYIISIRRELPNNAIIAYPCFFIYMVSSSEINYDEVFKNVKLIVNSDINEEVNLNSELSPTSIFVDFEKAAVNSLGKAFPSAQITNCFFHCLQSWRKKLCSLGFKPKIEKKNALFDPLFLQFWNYISGIPNCNMLLPSFQEQVKTELNNYLTILKFANDQEKANFVTFLDYLTTYYLSVTAQFSFTNWGQHSNIVMGNGKASRSTNVSESIHSSLNSNFPRRYTFNTSLDKLYDFKKGCIMTLSAHQPKKFFNLKIKASVKRPPRKSDTSRMTQLYDKVITFNLLPLETQISTLKTHAIDLGSLRRHAYETSKVWLTDDTDDSSMFE